MESIWILKFQDVDQCSRNYSLQNPAVKVIGHDDFYFFRSAFDTIHDEILSINHLSTKSGRPLAGKGKIRPSDVGKRILGESHKEKLQQIQALTTESTQVSDKHFFIVHFYH